MYRNQYIFGLPAEILGSRRRIQGSRGLPAPRNFESWVYFEPQVTENYDYVVFKSIMSDYDC